MIKGKFANLFNEALSRFGRDLFWALVASIALWAIIFMFLANRQGLQVFRYVQF